MRFFLTLKEKSTICTKQEGNVLFMILIAIAIIALLSNAIVQLSSPIDYKINESSTSIQTDVFLSYPTAIESSANEMISKGYDAVEISFIDPSNGAFETPPHAQKIFHPMAGGVHYHSSISGVSNFNIVAYTTINNIGTATSDIVFVTDHLTQDMCEEINTKLFNDPTLPSVGASAVTDMLANSAGSPVTLGGATCPECDGKPRMCFEDTDSNYVYYHVIIAR